MTAGRNWDRARDRSRVARQGAEAISSLRRGRRAASREADAAEIITKMLRCPCGHRGKVEMPACMLAGRRFVCSACGRKIG